jgi:ABC-type tungstate transport system, periplasmic component
MSYIIQGIKEAVILLLSFDTEIYKIIGLSILVSMVSTFIASIIGISLGIVTGLNQFPFKKQYTNFLYASMGLPPVVVGLVVAMLLARRGPLGNLELMFTVTGMIIAQTLLVTPIITGIVFGTVKERGNKIREICLTLGGSKFDLFILLIRELKKTILLAVTTGFGRGISEVGAVMLVGGNIKGFTRVMTTYIAMNNSMGNYSKSIAMGLVLLLISLLLNAFIHRLTGDTA